MQTWATQRLDSLIAGTASAPPVVQAMQLGTLDSWSPGLVKKQWDPRPNLLNGDGSMFGGYIAPLADQVLAFAAMTVVSHDMSFRTVNLFVNFIRVCARYSTSDRGPSDCSHAPIDHDESRIP